MGFGVYRVRGLDRRICRKLIVVVGFRPLVYLLLGSFGFQSR